VTTKRKESTILRGTKNERNEGYRCKHVSSEAHRGGKSICSDTTALPVTANVLLFPADHWVQQQEADNRLLMATTATPTFS